MDNRSKYEAGENFTFNLKLFCYGVEYLPFFIQSFRMAGEQGMGNPHLPGKFVIEQIISQGQSIYDAANDNLAIPELCSLSDSFDMSHDHCNSGLVLRLCTPLRHKSDNRFSASLEFTELFHLILRRVKALCLCADTQWNLAPEWYAKLRTAADEISITQNKLIWHDWTRYSSRQEAFMKFGGLLGTITYAGNVAIFQKLLQFAQITHIGKQTSFGLGRLELEYL